MLQLWPSTFGSRKYPKRPLVIALLTALLMLGGGVYYVSQHSLPTRVELDLQTGDRRYSWWGILKGSDFSLKPPLRSAIVDLASHSSRLNHRWVRIPFTDRDHLTETLIELLEFTASWHGIDDRIGQLMLEDIAAWLHGPDSDDDYSLIFEIRSLRLDDQIYDDIPRAIQPAWKSSQALKDYCLKRGYELK